MRPEQCGSLAPCGVGDDSVDSDRGQHERERAKDQHQIILETSTILDGKGGTLKSQRIVVTGSNKKLYQIKIGCAVQVGGCAGS